MTKFFKKNNQGYSLIEISVVLSIFLFLVILSTEFIIRGLKSNTFADEQSTAVQNARKAADIMVKEIRKANQAENGNYLLATATPQSFIFYGDVDDDDKTERIRYYLDGTNLKRGIIKATGSPIGYPTANESISVLANYVNNNSDPMFYYNDKNNIQIADSTAGIRSIRLVKLNIKINVTPATAPNDYFVKSNVMIRNLKDNL
jgi:prepilin-type N-terminal cleavage/methylation domain-containing protein